VGICKVYEFGYLLYNDKRKYVYAILENVPVLFYTHIKPIKTTLKPIIKQLLQAINFLHANNVSHLDIKHCNLGFNSDGQLKIFDFGLAVINHYKSRFSHILKQDHPEGTFHYMDPFYFYSRIHSNISDVYSVGVILFEIFFQLNYKWNPDEPLINIYWEPSVLCGPYGLSKCVSWKEFVVRSDTRDHPDINTPTKIESLKTLLYGMLQPNPMFRMTAADALCHPWLDEHMTCGSPRTSISHGLSQKKHLSETTNSRGLSGSQKKRKTTRSRSSSGSGSSRSRAKNRKTSSS
jgi:serine/threonine protein kinase